MNLRKLLSLTCLLLAILCAATAAYLGFTESARSPRILREDPEARLAASRLMECLCAGQFRQAGAFLQGQPSLALPQEEGDDAQTLLWNHYRRSLTGELTGEPYLTGQGYFQDAVLRTADLTALTRRMKALAPGLLTQRIEEAEDPAQIYTADLSLREELIADLLRQAAQTAIEQSSPTQEVRLRLRLCYDQDAWRVQPDQALMDILAGRMEKD